jgi:hypothetical protein
LGELNGHYGITTSTIGLGLGVSNGTAAPTGAVLTVDPTNGLKIASDDGYMVIDDNGIRLWFNEDNASVNDSQSIRWIGDSQETVIASVNADNIGYSLVLDSANVVVTGDLVQVQAYGNIKKLYGTTLYTGYITVPLATPATSTSWDGDAKDSGDNGIIDLSTVFSLPAGIKGVFAKLSAKNTSASGKYSCLGPDATNYYALQVTPRDTADIYLNNGPAFVPCDSNGDIYFKTDAANGAENIVAISIWGYLI